MMRDPRIAKIYEELEKEKQEYVDNFEYAVLTKLDEIITKLDELEKKLDCPPSSDSSWLFGNAGPEI